MVKHVLLFGIAIFTNQLYLLSVLHSELSKDGYTWIMRTSQAIEVNINIIVLWLILRRNHTKYIRLCKLCHICIGKCCFENVDDMELMEDPYYESTTELSHART